MKDIKNEIINTFGNKLRIRVCGILLRGNEILLIKHNNIGETGVLWAPPGGGVNFGESCEEALIREYEEETGLSINIKKFLFVNEYLSPPLHALELFFQVTIKGGTLQQGSDPEVVNQIIDDIKFLDYEEINKADRKSFHSVITRVQNSESLLQLRGYLKNP